MFSSLVVGTDGSATAAQAVRSATELAKALSATLHIVTVYKPSPVKTSGATEDFPGLGAGGQAEALLDDQCARARAAGVRVEGHAETGDPAEAIVRVAEQEQADLIVVGNRGMTGVRRVLGSVPNSVAHQAPCSVLIVQTT